MRAFPVADIFVAESVAANARASARAGRISRALGGSPVTVSDQDLTRRWQQRPACRAGAFSHRTGSFDYSGGWTVLLGSYAQGEGLDRGVIPTTFRDGARQMRGDGVCQSALELHAAFGCFHRCAYCFCDPYLYFACDLERLVEDLPGLFDAYPKQQLFKFDNLTDTVALEPELGASELLVPRFAETEDRFLLLYTKSDNVDHLLDLPHGGHTIVNWSLSVPTQSRVVEINTPETASRIDAMRRCQEAGYPVRARISPIVPLAGWREEFPGFVDALFDAVRPDVITLDVVGWCDPRALAEVVEPDTLEAPCRTELEQLIESGDRETGKYLFSHELRQSVLSFALQELRRRSPETPAVICNETQAMWTALSGLLSGKPGDYVCCCGPDSVPGHSPL